jgi:hypothetical protein
MHSKRQFAWLGTRAGVQVRRKQIDVKLNYYKQMLVFALSVNDDDDLRQFLSFFAFLLEKTQKRRPPPPPRFQLELL